jgi:hypothetical protein
VETAADRSGISPQVQVDLAGEAVLAVSAVAALVAVAPVEAGNDNLTFL